jgi:hypothetical protein
MMVVDRVNGQVQANMDDMELIVTAANITGYFENAGKIVVGDDMELTQFCLNVVNKYYQDTDIDVAFPEFVEALVLQTFAIQS